MITTVDVGATKTLVAQFDDRMQLLHESRFPTPEATNSFLNELTRSIDKLSDTSMISVAIPGIVLNGVAVVCPNLPLWKDFPIQEELEKKYKCPVLVENDANLAGLAEINRLSPVPKVGLYITVSTGIGTGLIAEGRLTPALARSEVGHMVFWSDGVWQEWEEFASGRALAKHFGKKASDLSRPEEWQWVAEKVSIGLCAIIPALRPEVIVFGGGVGAHLDKFLTPLKKLLEQRLANSKFHFIPQLLSAQHPNEAVLYGCYYYALHNKHSR
jgi:predicted NBD/HSP70 family sugar kinase